jgi:hypothetical protein
MSELNMQQLGFCMLMVAASLWTVAVLSLALAKPSEKTWALFWKGSSSWAVIGLLLSLSPLVYEKL